MVYIVITVLLIQISIIVVMGHVLRLQRDIQETLEESLEEASLFRRLYVVEKAEEVADLKRQLANAHMSLELVLGDMDPSKSA